MQFTRKLTGRGIDAGEGGGRGPEEEGEAEEAGTKEEAEEAEEEEGGGGGDVLVQAGHLSSMLQEDAEVTPSPTGPVNLHEFLLSKLICDH
jgi:hypothetical protein